MNNPRNPRGHAKKSITSMRGKNIDMEAMRAAQEESVAIGNARMNARGDILGKGGKIEIRREQIIRDFYNRHPQGTANVSLKPALPDTFETPAQALARVTSLADQQATPPAPPAPAADMDPVAVADKKTRKLVNKDD